MSPTPLFVGIDGGQSATRAIVANSMGEILGAAVCGPSNRIHARDARTDAVRASMESALVDAAVQDPVVVGVAVGLSGFSASLAMVSDVKAQVGQVTRAHHVEVVADYVAAFVAALDDELGVVIVAGSGSVAYGVGPNGGPVRAGGAGYLFGDEGSAFDVGRRGIIAAVKAADGRGPNSILAEEVLTYFEVSDLREVLRLIYTRPLDRPTIAAFAQVVTRGAREGDDAAMEIIRGAAQDQCELALAVLQRTFPRDVVAPVRMIGGLVESGEIILEQVRAMLLSRWPSAEVACSPFRTEVGSLKIAFTTSGLPIPDRLRATP